MRGAKAFSVCVCVSGFVLAGCGSSREQGKPVASPAHSVRAETASAPAPSSDGSAAAAKNAQPDAVAASPDSPGVIDNERDGLRKASRPPGDMITDPNVLYVFNFSSSEVGAAAQKRCSEESPDDFAELRECLKKARSAVPVESIRFQKDKAGVWWFLTYNTYKGNLLKWHKVQFAQGEQTDETIVVKLMGKDKGIAPMARVPRSLLIELPNDYSIIVNDPEYGKMVYDAKIGWME